MSISITVADVTLAPSIADAMISARWKDPHWVALFKSDISSSKVTLDTAQRLPWNLITARASNRHQIAIDDTTGKVVAYARWILPEHLASADSVIWPEAQVKEPCTAEEKTESEKMFKEVTDRGLRMDLLEYRSAPLEATDAKIRESGSFLGMHAYITLLFHPSWRNWLTVCFGNRIGLLGHCTRVSMQRHRYNVTKSWSWSG